MIEVLYFGCLGEAGHYLKSKSRNIRSHETPWGVYLDGGILKGRTGSGQIVVDHKDGWTAIDFCDYSVDTRGGSHSAFIVAVELPGEEVLRLAKEQWPEVFSRKGFPQLEFVKRDEDNKL